MLKILSRNNEEGSDEALLSAFKSSGQLHYLSELYGRYVELTYGLCLKYLQDGKKAEDAVMDIFEALTIKVPQHEISNFKSWLYTFSRNHCLMYLRKQKKDITKNYAPDVMYSLEDLHPIEEGNEEAKRKEQQEEILRKCMEQLAREQQQCVTLFYYQNKTYKEIASKNNMEVGKVRSHIQNGRRNLKNCIERNQ